MNNAMQNIKINRQVLIWMYQQGFTVKQMVNYLNENYSEKDVKFTTRHISQLYKTIGMNLRKKPRHSFQIEIVEEEIGGIEEIENPSEDPYFTENIEEIPDLNNLIY